MNNILKNWEYLQGTSSTITILTPEDLDMYYQIANRNRCFSAQEIEDDITGAFAEMRIWEQASGLELAEWLNNLERKP